MDRADRISSPAVARRTRACVAVFAQRHAGERARSRFSFAHGGKDGFPWPVDVETYDKTVHVLREAVNKANIDRSERVKALKRLVEYGRERISRRRSGDQETNAGE